jgi:hypothetical protein
VVIHRDRGSACKADNGDEPADSLLGGLAHKPRPSS